jgi:uncharacterized repeat protein (TIGR01451 family)
MKTIITLILSFLTSLIYAQNNHKIEWLKNIPGNGYTKIYDLACDAHNNIYIAGTFEGTTNFDVKGGTFTLTENTGLPQGAAFLVKYNDQMDLVWCTKIDTSSLVTPSIEIDNTGNLIYFDNSGRFRKYSINNHIIFSHQFTWLSGQPKVQNDSYNNIIIGGQFCGDIYLDPNNPIYNLSTVGCNADFIAKYSSYGTFINAFKLNGGGAINDLQVSQSNSIYIGGWDVATDYNPGPGVAPSTNTNIYSHYVAKYDENLNFQYHQTIAGKLNSFRLDHLSNIYITGEFSGSLDFNVQPPNNPTIGSSPSNTNNAFLLKLDSSANYIFVNTFPFAQPGTTSNFIELINDKVYLYSDVGVNSRLICNDVNGGSVFLFNNFHNGQAFVGNNVSPGAIAKDKDGNLLFTGTFNENASFQDNFGNSNISPTGNNDAYISKLDKGVFGKAYNDFNSNGIYDNGEDPLADVNIYDLTNDKLVSSDSMGYYFISNELQTNDLLLADEPNSWHITTQNPQFYNNPIVNDTLPYFGYSADNPCNAPEITIFAPFLRRCFSNQIVYVQACNHNFASAPLNSSFVVVTLDPLLTVNSASIPFTALGNNTYQFQTGTLNPGQCVNFTLSTTVSCNATLGQTLCMNAELFPVENCAFDTLPSGPNWDNIPSEGALGGLPQPCLGPWDQSSLSVNGWCQNDSIYFTVTNTGVLGGGDMECYAPVWLTVNGVVTFTDSIMLQGGQTITYAFEGNGQTWILNASQHPLHPGNSQPNAFVERCGNAANWNPGEVNDYPQDDADPVIDIFCEEVSGSYDPNDKRGYPNGVTNMNYIQPNQQLQYVIRFQNTGTDTAFTVVIRDTLDTDLNIFTVTPGVSSHSYEFRMYGPRVLEWRFDNILLPDSTTNSVGSNGFVTFHVEQNPNLAPGTVINNDADIYFDYNDPITTNTTVHRIYEGFPNVLSLQDLVNSKESIVLYPNPTSSEITITSDKFTDEPYTLFDQMGRTVGSGKLSGTNTTISLSNLSKGIYILKVEGAYESAIVVKE